jgi:hypothetical protein
LGLLYVMKSKERMKHFRIKQQITYRMGKL